jgi:hypothetical protein
MTAIQEMIEIIKQKRNESEISNTLLKFVYDEAIRLLEKEKKQQIYNMTNGNKAIISKEELLEIYKKKL